MESNQNLKNKEYIGIFQYFNEDFYMFLKSVSRGNTNRKIRFKNKITKIITPSDAFLIKNYIDNMNLKYKNNKIKTLLNHSNIIQSILNNIRNIKMYK